MKSRSRPAVAAVRAPDDSGAGRRGVRGHLADRVPASPAPPHDARIDVRRRTRLWSVKILDGGGAFLCEALVQDRSRSGLRLLLSRNLGLPPRFGVHDDSTREIVTASAVWRRDRTVGVRILTAEPPTPLRAVARVALATPYYGVRG